MMNERGPEIARILIVDDQELVRFVMERALAKLEPRCHLESASGGHEAIGMMEAERPDLLITDIKMPGGGGVELTEHMRSQGIDTTVVWMTAHGCEAYREDVERLSVYQCIEKPLEVNAIREVVKKALEHRGSRG